VLRAAEFVFLVLLLLAAFTPTVCSGQFVPAFIQSGSQFELAETVQLDRADSGVLQQLERVKAYVAERQWDEAIESLRQLMDSSEGKLLPVSEHRLVSVGDYCQMQLATLPSEALKLYRGRIDPLAQRWYEEGVARRDRHLLQNVLRRAFASSWGDKALLADGELALETGDYTAARNDWERIIPATPPPGVANTWNGYPDTRLDLAAVRARLVLVSILDGQIARARQELAQLDHLHPDAHGWFAGRETNYVKALEELLAESATWPAARPSRDWPTFAGAPSRNAVAAPPADLRGVTWRMALPRLPVSTPLLAPVGRSTPPLSWHPVLSDGRVLVNNPLEIVAVDAVHGKPLWGAKTTTIYRDAEDAALQATEPGEAFGTPRYTLTVFQDRLYARLGSVVTSRPQQPAATTSGNFIVSLDLAAEGRLVWKYAPEPGWTIEGSPLADGRHVYVSMRRSDIRPQEHVACLDAQTGRLRWRRFVAAAETPARGMSPEITHNLLTLAAGTVYCNTNLGAVAALDGDDGRLLWVNLYPRARRGDLQHLAPHWRRDLNPCLMDHGTLLVAPADTPNILALDAANGQILWQSGTEVEDVVHLLGVAGDQLIASGQRLYWIGLRDDARGRVKHVWPESSDKPGYGRGVLAGDAVYFPARDKIYVFDQHTAQPRKVLDLAAWGARGGNLMAGGGRLFIATDTELAAIGPLGSTTPPSDEYPIAKKRSWVLGLGSWISNSEPGLDSKTLIRRPKT
jgi:outer membrane protein assembly factor BamB